MVLIDESQDKGTIDEPIASTPIQIPVLKVITKTEDSSPTRTIDTPPIIITEAESSEDDTSDEVQVCTGVSLEDEDVEYDSRATSADLGSPRSDRSSISRDVSPMQEVIIRENEWNKTLKKVDTLFSEVSAVKKGYFNLMYFTQTFHNETTLTLLFQLFDYDRTGYIKQDDLVDKARLNFRGENGRQWVELLDVLAYVICGEDVDVSEECFKKIFTSKGVVEKLFKYVNKDSDGQVSRKDIMDLIANLTYARPRQALQTKNLEYLEEMFRQYLGSKQELNCDDFKKIVQTKNSFFAERVFNVFDRDKSGTVSLAEFLDAMHEYAGKSPNDKIKFLFRVYDLDGDGLIQRYELHQVIKACMEENGMKFCDEQIEDLTLALFEDAATDQRKVITFEALKAQLEKHPGLLENLSISIDRWLVPPEPQAKPSNLFEKLKKLRPYQLTLPYLRNNYVYIFFLLSFFAVNIGLFIDRFVEIQTKHENCLYSFARASGQALNFNCIFVLILVLRQCITFLRTHGASTFLPLDQNLYLHKLTGFVIVFHSSLHTLMHLINFPLNVAPGSGYTIWEWFFTDHPGKFGLVDGWANPTGFILVVVLLIIFICSLPFVRKSGYFEVFYWTHLLYVFFFILTILHGPHFWKWFILPGVLFLIEKIYRTIRMRSGHGKTYISSGILLPSKVIHLVIQKPSTFNYCPGDYVFVNIPAIAKYEWHPFTISSAPEQNGVVWLHIRAVGQWTNRLYSYFEKQQLQCEKQASLSITEVSDTKIMIDAEKEDQQSSNDEFDESSRTAIRKNGVMNQTFVSDNDVELKVADDSEEGSDEGASKSTTELNGDNMKISKFRGYLAKKPLFRACSVPDFGSKVKKRERNLHLRENWRNNSLTVSELPKISETENGRKSSKDLTQRSVAMSIRYMRHRPKVVTLDLPEEISEEEESYSDSDDENTNEEGETDLEGGGNSSAALKAPQQATAVRRGGTRIFATLSAPLHQRHKNLASTRRQSEKRVRSRQESQRKRRISRLKEATESFGICSLGKPLPIYVDGPYGAPSSHMFTAQHAVLIATGIGVTPFASILQSIMHKYLKARQTCPRCTHAWTEDIPQSVMNLRKVDFFWINRDQRSFEWFVNLLSQLEIEQAEQGGVLERFLDMHMYITSALQKTDMKAVGLQLALELLHEKEKRDLITGLKTRTNAGRPNWDKVFKQLAVQNKGKITVFYCGPPALARTLRYKCDEYGFIFRKEIF